MSQEDETQKAGSADTQKNTQTTQTAETGGQQKPPWDAENFDAERAWKLVTDLREDNTKVKGDRDALATKVKAHEDATKSDQEKLTERSTSAEKTATEAQQEAARLRVALRKGLTETQAKRLVGTTEKELEKDADDLVASFKTEVTEEETSTRRRPQERLKSGVAPGAEAEKNDPASLAARVKRRW